VTDDNDKTGEAYCLVNDVAPTSTYTLSSRFKIEGAVPQDWYACSGSTKRAGGGLAYTSGPRTLRFTASTKAFTYGLFVQNTSGKEKGAWARFGDEAGRSRLTLHAGHYIIKYKVCNWNRAEFTPVTLSIEDPDGQEVASQTYTPTVNIGGKTSNKFTGVEQQTFEFDITETGDYVIAFYADASRNADFVLGQASIQAKEFFTTGIQDISERNERKVPGTSHVYDLGGRRVDEGNLKRGIYIIDGRKVVIQHE
jgi:hypothetical protein